MLMKTNQKRHRTTVGSIVVPELPWKREEPEECPTCQHGTESWRVDDSCNQVDCDCTDPFHCIG